MKVLILAAGYGTRLYPLTIDMPKALLEIGNKRLIDFLIDKIKALGEKDIAVVVNDRFYFDFLEWSKQYSFPIDIINDQTKTPEERLGAVGDIEYVLKNKDIQDDLLVLGGDNLFSWDLNEFCESASKIAKPVIGLYDIGSLEEATRFGVVSLDGQGRIVNLEEKPSLPKTTLAATCIYFFPKPSLGLMDEYSSLKHDKDTSGQYISWLAKKTDVRGHVFKGDWFDIGHKDSLEQAKKSFGY
ncbi:MAG: nucleotidyltransferase family protein [Candidatus Omnitrophica bacterium]|nr:nucleotidyltransferase family protein [Candidatus Omnitrophota bacterium]